MHLEALRVPKWKASINLECHALVTRGSWELVRGQILVDKPSKILIKTLKATKYNVIFFL